MFHSREVMAKTNVVAATEVILTVRTGSEVNLEATPEGIGNVPVDLGITTAVVITTVAVLGTNGSREETLDLITFHNMATIATEGLRRWFWDRRRSLVLAVGNKAI